MNDRFGGLSPRAKKVLALALDEARRFNHAYVGNEHLLIGLARESEGVAAKALVRVGVDAPRLREALLFHTTPGDHPVEGEPPLTPRLERVLALAGEEALARKSPLIGTEHLLLALLRQDERREAGWIALLMLETAGAQPEQVRSAVLEECLRAEVLARSLSVSGTRDSVVTCRVDQRALETLDALVEAGVYTTRSEAAARLIRAGIEANQPLLVKVFAAVAEIRRVRGETQALTQTWKEGHAGASVGPTPDQERWTVPHDEEGWTLPHQREHATEQTKRD